MREKLTDNLRYCSKHIKDFKMNPCCYCGYEEGNQCPGTIFDDAADEIERLQAEVDRLQALWEGAEICGYNAKYLIMFADACREQHVTNEDLKKVATDLTWAVQTVYDATKRAMENVSFEKTNDGCMASVKYIFPPPVNPNRLKQMNFKWDISGCKSVKLSDLKYKEIKDYDPNRPD